MRKELDTFLHALVTSGLMSAEDVREFCDKLPGGSQPASAAALVSALVESKRLTQFQAERLMEGQIKGLVLGNVVVLDKLGAGGMGEVYRAEHRRMKRQVVVKLLSTGARKSAALLKRFQREIEAAARLLHPNIVTAYDADEIDGVHFLVMEYIDGEDLASLVERHGPFALETAVSCMLQAAQGLQFAHSQGVVHRDIKPSNLLLDRSHTIKILDMGLALLHGAHAADEPLDGLTDNKNILGTVEYMSPEQADDSSVVDHRTDIYSLGCTLFRLLSGVPPFRRETPIKTLMAHREAPIPALRELRPEVTPQLEAIFQRMVAKLPEDRYASMQNVIDDLNEWLEHAEFEVGAISFPAVGQPVSRAHVPATANADRTVMLGKEDTDSSHIRVRSAKRRRPRAVGIDLGTTYSAIAHLDDLGRPQTINNIEGEKITPSMILLDGQEIVVGKEALKAMATDMESVAACPKRDVGSPAYHRLLAGRKYPPEVLEALVLRKLAHDARQQVAEFNQVVITVPAYFDEVRRKATQDAGYIAGLDVIDIINEPTAAALAFAFQRGLLLPTGDQAPLRKVLIYDLGGGTFDVTVMKIEGRQLKTLATDGDMRLGGLDWDQRLIDYVAEQYLQQYGDDPRLDSNTLGRLWRDCEDAKRTLSTRSKTLIECHHRGHSVQVPLTREQFEAMTMDLLDRTSFTTRQALKNSGLAWKDIHHVLLVGGATRMPAVRELLKQLSGQEPDVSVSPDEAVAHGAALHAHLVLARHGGLPPPFHVTNVNSHSLGILATDAVTRQRQNAILIPRNTPLPAMARRVFLTQKENQRSVLVQIMEGESSDPRDCTPLGKCSVRDLPPDLPRHTPVDVCFQYEENGRLSVSVTLPKSGKEVKHYLARPNTLTTEEREYWRKLLAPTSQQPV
jgi:molecular chaperone DnaK